jgi:D-alanine-D-alanine ligase-like ATP-grasp enzyme
MMKICVLEDDCGQSTVPFKEYDPLADVEFYFGQYEWERHLLQKQTAVKQIKHLARQGFDVFLNLCDGTWEEDRPGIEVVQALEQLGAAFTGANSTFYAPPRRLFKLACYYANVPTPMYRFVNDASAVEATGESLHFPLMIKPPDEHNSIGLTPASCVHTVTDLRQQLEQCLATYGEALIEEFIEGREFSVLVAENADDVTNPTAYRPIEFLFPTGETFKHFSLKWEEYQGMHTVSCPDPLLANRLETISKDLFTLFHGTGYARFDIRMNVAGELFVIDINPNCSIFYPPGQESSADYILRSDPRGHQHFIEQILRAASKRRDEQLCNWEVRLGEQGYGVYATRTIRAGELIQPYEEQPQVLVSRAHAERSWTESQKRDFRRYAYPLTEELWVMWTKSPADWRPLNHSCDPTAWLEGLDVVARRDIQAGEQITLDYATFCNEVMEEFVCQCGARDCRGIIRGADHLQPFVGRYGDHVSDYVRTKRARMKVI